MPGSYLTLFRDVSEQTSDETKGRLADGIWEVIAESLEYSPKGVDVRWLSPADRRFSRNATSVHLIVEFTADEKLKGDADTLQRLGDNLLGLLNAGLPETVAVAEVGTRVDVDYDVWIKTFGWSTLTYYGNGIVGKGFKGSVGGLPPPQQDQPAPS